MWQLGKAHWKSCDLLHHEHSARLDIMDQNGRNIFWYAARRGHYEIFEYVLKSDLTLEHGGAKIRDILNARGLRWITRDCPGDYNIDARRRKITRCILEPSSLGLQRRQCADDRRTHCKWLERGNCLIDRSRRRLEFLLNWHITTGKRRNLKSCLRQLEA